MKTSKKILLGVTAALLFTGCDLFKEDGVVNLTTKPYLKYMQMENMYKSLATE